MYWSTLRERTSMSALDIQEEEDCICFSLTRKHTQVHGWVTTSGSQHILPITGHRRLSHKSHRKSLVGRHEELVPWIYTGDRDVSLEMVLGKWYPCLKTKLISVSYKLQKKNLQEENTKEMLQALAIANAWGVRPQNTGNKTKNGVMGLQQTNIYTEENLTEWRDNAQDRQSCHFRPNGMY